MLTMFVGYEVSGVITKIGTEAGAFDIGDEVVGVIPIDQGGGCAEYAVLKVYNIIKKPKVSPFLATKKKFPRFIPSFSFIRQKKSFGKIQADFFKGHFTRRCSGIDWSRTSRVFCPSLQI